MMYYRTTGMFAIACAVLLLASNSPAEAATIRLGGACNLTRAIIAANQDRRIATCAAGLGADSIVLRLNERISPRIVNNIFYGSTAYPVIRSRIIIFGKGGIIERADDTPAFRFFAVGPRGNLTLQNITLTGAGADIDGGAIYSNGSLNVRNSTLTENSALRGGAVYVDGEFSAQGFFSTYNSTISGNTAGYGGGIYAGDYAQVTILFTTVTQNVGVFGAGRDPRKHPWFASLLLLYRFRQRGAR